MTLLAQNWPGFGAGLNLYRSAQGDGTAAIDAMNVLFTSEGSVYSRPGYSNLITGSSGSAFGAVCVYQTRAGVRQILAAKGNVITAYTTAGAVVSGSATTGFTSPDFQFVRFGNSTADYVYVTNGVDTPKRWDGATWTSWTAGATVMTGRVVSPALEYRVALAGFSGTTGNSPSTVKFSDPSEPTVFSSSIDVNPGDGERITAMAVYQQQLFVFKTNSMHVVYGSSTSGGNTTWNWRTIVDSVGCGGPDAVTVGPDGVYFAHSTGIYVTQGGKPEVISQNIEPLFLGRAPSTWSGGVISTAQLYSSSLIWHQGRLRFATGVGGSDLHTRVFVYDVQQDWWSVGDQRYNAMAVGPLDTGGQAYLVASLESTALPAVVVERASDTLDAGAPIAAVWHSDWTDLGINQRKTNNGLRVWGEGKVFVGLGGDFRVAQNKREVDFGAQTDLWGDGASVGGVPVQTWGAGTNVNDLWGGGQASRGRYARAGVRGTTFALVVQSADGDPWYFHRATTQLRGVQPIATITESE